jgi:azurin
MRSRLAALPLVLLLAAALVGCGGSDSSSSAPESASASSSATPPQSASSASADVDQTITIQPKGNQMRYKQTEFTVAPGQTIKLVFDNTATSPSMQHNVVVITSTKESVFRRVGEGGMSAGSTNDYVPEDDAILAYTSMAKPGETVSVTFTVPEEPGDYGYLCTFPGHWATMQGTMHVKKSAA